MTHFFAKRDRWGHGLALWVLLAMVFAIPPALWSLRQVRLENDIENWLPADDPEALKLQWYLRNFTQEDLALVSWAGSTLNDPRVPLLARRLEGIPDASGIRRGGMKEVAHVVTPHDVLARVTAPREEALERLRGVFIGTGALKVRLTDRGREQQQQVIAAVKARAKSELGVELQSLPPLTTWIPPADFPFAELEEAGVLPETPFPEVPPHDFQLRWDGMQPSGSHIDDIKHVLLAAADTDGAPLVEEAFIDLGSPVALYIALSEAGMADRTRTFQEVRRIAAEVGIPPEDFHVGGRPVASAALNHAVARSAWNPEYSWLELHKRSPILLSGLVGIVLAFVMLRNVRLATLVLIVAYYTVFATVALVPVTGGSMNMVLVVMPTLLLVITVSGAIHVANYWKHAAAVDLSTAVVNAVRMAWLPCLLAAVTTAIGLLSLLTSSLTPVRDFGLYSAVGCLIAVVMVLYGLPSLMQFWPARKPPREEEINATGWIALGRWLSRHHRSVTLGTIALCAVSSYGLVWFRTETKVIRYFPDHSRLVQDYNFLEENMAGIVPVDVIVRFSEEAQSDLNFLQRLEVVRDVEQNIRRHPDISGTLSLADFRPVSEAPGDDASVAQRLRYNRSASATEQRVREENAADVKKFLSIPVTATPPAEPGKPALNEAGDELWRITAQVAIMSELDYGHLTQELHETTADVLKFHPGAGHVVTGMVPVFLKTQQAVLESLINSFGLAFVLISIVLMVILRNPLGGLIAMLPNLIPVTTVFGLISWYGLRVDIGTMITASVALGIAVDGTLHLLTWFRTGIAEGRTRQEAVALALGHCGPAMWQTSFAISMGLLVLYPAELLLISRFGWLMAAMVMAALLSDIIFLSALLAGPLGRLLERAPKQEHAADPTQPDARKGGPAKTPHLHIANHTAERVAPRDT